MICCSLCPKEQIRIKKQLMGLRSGISYHNCGPSHNSSNSLCSGSSLPFSHRRFERIHRRQPSTLSLSACFLCGPRPTLCGFTVYDSARIQNDGFAVSYLYCFFCFLFIVPDKSFLCTAVLLNTKVFPTCSFGVQEHTLAQFCQIALTDSYFYGLPAGHEHSDGNQIGRARVYRGENNKTDSYSMHGCAFSLK